MNLPNRLTLFRIFLIPIFTIILAVPQFGSSLAFGGATFTWNALVATLIFIVASLTDLADGKIARAKHLVTNFGKFADPLADKLLVMTAFIFLVKMNVVPAWVAAIIIWRELAVTGLRLLLAQTEGEFLAAAMPGKIKTTTQMIAIIFLLLNNIFFAAINFPFATIMLYICLIFTVYSGADYFIKNRQVFADSFGKN